MAYRVTIEEIAECPTAVVKANTTWREFPTLWRTLLDDVWAFLRATPGLRAHGHNVMLYRNGTAEGRAEAIARIGELSGGVLDGFLPFAAEDVEEEFLDLRRQPLVPKNVLDIFLREVEGKNTAVMFIVELDDHERALDRNDVAHFTFVQFVHNIFQRF